jgi:hypothetical protein
MSISRPNPLLDIKEQKKLYNKYVTEARNIEKSTTPDWKQCLKLYEGAYALIQIDTKLLKKIETVRSKLERFVKQPENNFIYDSHDKVYILKSEDDESEFKLPRFVYDKLYNYQRESMEWFWKKHCLALEEDVSNGGILGDDVSRNLTKSNILDGIRKIFPDN